MLASDGSTVGSSGGTRGVAAGGLQWIGRICLFFGRASTGLMCKLPTEGRRPADATALKDGVSGDDTQHLELFCPGCVLLLPGYREQVASGVEHGEPEALAEWTACDAALAFVTRYEDELARADDFSAVPALAPSIGTNIGTHSF